MVSETKKTEQKGDRRELTYALGVTALLLLASLALVIASSYIVPSPFAGQVDFPTECVNHTACEGQPRPEDVSFTVRTSEVESYMLLRVAFSLINVLIVIYLLFIHVRDYLKLRAGFTLGIIAFLLAFLLFALSSIPIPHFILGARGLSSVFSFVPLVFSAASLLIFAKLSNE